MERKVGEVFEYQGKKLRVEESNAWLARDECGDLYLYIFEKPRKVNVDWFTNGTHFFKLREERFPEVKWSDEEPTKVKLVIEK